MLTDLPRKDAAPARAGGWLRSLRSANPPPAPRRSGASAVRAAVRHASGDDYAFVPPVAPSSRTDRFCMTVIPPTLACILRLADHDLVKGTLAVTANATNGFRTNLNNRNYRLAMESARRS